MDTDVDDYIDFEPGDHVAPKGKLKIVKRTMNPAVVIQTAALVMNSNLSQFPMQSTEPRPPSDAGPELQLRDRVVLAEVNR